MLDENCERSADADATRTTLQPPDAVGIKRTRNQTIASWDMHHDIEEEMERLEGHWRRRFRDTTKADKTELTQGSLDLETMLRRDLLG